MSRWVAIVGSRNYGKLHLVQEYVDSLPDDTTIVSGGARGVDAAAEQAGLERGLHVRSFRVAEDVKRGLFYCNVYDDGQLRLTAYKGRIHGSFGKAAFQRNHYIVDDADEVVAFWDGESKGTRNTIDIAEEAGRPLTVYHKDA